MGALLALGAALVYGGGDFAGGTASRRVGALAVLMVSLPAGAVIIALAALAVPGDPSAAGLGWGALAGLAGALAFPLFYAGLAVGPMTVVAPVSALMAAVIPVIVGTATGERLSGLAVAGVVLCLLAIILVSLEPRVPGEVRAPLLGRGLLLGLAAGVGFGLFFVLLAPAPDDAGLWPLVSSRLVGTGVVAAGIILIRRRNPVAVGAHAVRIPMVGLASLGDSGANVLYLLALQTGELLALVAVLTSLYPAGTVLLAKVVHHEVLHPARKAGLALAVGGALLVALR